MRAKPIHIGARIRFHGGNGHSENWTVVGVMYCGERVYFCQNKEKDVALYPGDFLEPKYAEETGDYGE